MAMIDLTGVSLNVVHRGHGLPLLLVHGFPLDHSMWSAQLDGLSEVCQVIAPDLRGFGQSGGDDDVFTMEGFADDLAELIEAMAITEPITFCGLSMGGYIAWQFWQRHQDRVARLILCDTRADADPEEVARGRRMTAASIGRKGVEEFVGGMIPKLFAEQTVRERPDVIEETHRVMLGTRPVSVAAALKGMAERVDMTDALPECTVPTLVICGEHDSISPSDEMRAFAKAMPHAQFVEVPNAGHMAPLEQPDVVNNTIREFLR